MATARDLDTFAGAIVGEESMVNYVGISCRTIVGSRFVNCERVRSLPMSSLLMVVLRVSASSP